MISITCDNCGAERPERLPMLDPLIELILHLRSARIGDDAACAECTRPKLRASLKPAEHLPFGQQFCRIGTDIGARFRAGLQADAALLCRVFDRFIGVLNTEVRVLHHE